MINNNGNYMYLIRWYGPFYSRQDLEDWEREQESLFYLYLFQGKRKNKVIIADTVFFEGIDTLTLQPMSYRPTKEGVYL